MCFMLLMFLINVNFCLWGWLFLAVSLTFKSLTFNFQSLLVSFSLFQSLQKVVGSLRKFRPSICPMSVLCLNECTCRHTFLTLWQGHHSNFRESQCRYKIPRGTHQRSFKYTGWENFANIAFYLGNGTRQAHGYCGSLIESHRQPIYPCRFQCVQEGVTGLGEQDCGSYC